MAARRWASGSEGAVGIRENRSSVGSYPSMATLQDPEVRQLLEQPNYAVVSTLNPDGSVLDTVVWIDGDDGAVAINSAIGRRWPTNLLRDPRVTAIVLEAGNPYNYLEIRGRAEPIEGEEAEAHIDRLSRKYTNRDFPGRQPGERRIKFVVQPEHIRHKHG